MARSSTEVLDTSLDNAIKDNPEIAATPTPTETPAVVTPEVKTETPAPEVVTPESKSPQEVPIKQILEDNRTAFGKLLEKYAPKDTTPKPELPSAENFYGFGTVENFDKEYAKNAGAALAKLNKGQMIANKAELMELMRPEFDQLRQPLENMQLERMYKQTFDSYPEFAPGTEGFKVAQAMQERNPKLTAALTEMQDKGVLNATEMLGIIAYYPILRKQNQELRGKTDTRGDPKAAAKQVTAPSTQGGLKQGTLSLDEEFDQLAKEHGITDPDMLATMKRDPLFRSKKK